MNKEFIIAEIERLIMLSIVTPYGIGYLNLPDTTRTNFEKIGFGTTANKFILDSRSGRVELNVADAIAKYRSEPKNNLTLINQMPMFAILYIHDLLKNNNLLKHTAEYEFLRHIRNAIGHGNRFTFHNGEPKRLASFQGMDIDASLDGLQDIVGKYLSPGDLINLLNFIKSDLLAEI